MPANQDFTYNENDWLDSDTYDANGNTLASLASDPQASGLKSQASDVYDFRNRLIRRTYTSGLNLDYTYNARGTRIGKAKRIGGALVNRKLFVVDDQNGTGYVQTLEEWTASGFDAVILDKVYDYGLDLVSQTRFEWDAQTSSLKPHTSYLIYDGHGSVRALADESGTITDTYTYDAFGIQLSQQVYNPDSGSLESIVPNNSHRITDNSYLYAGEYFDTDLGLYYLRARHMNPETGRFHTMDTYEGRLGEPLSLHKYLYAHANPVMGIDPSGMFFSTVYFAAVQATQQILEAAKQVRAQFAISVATGGRMLHQLGYAVQTQAERIIRMVQSGASIDPNKFIYGPGGRRAIDFIVEASNRIAYIEVKYKLPSRAGDSLARLVGQMQTATANGHTVLFTFKEPTAQEMRLLLEHLGPDLFYGVQHVHGFLGLAQWLRMYFGG